MPHAFCDRCAGKGMAASGLSAAAGGAGSPDLCGLWLPNSPGHLGVPLGLLGRRGAVGVLRPHGACQCALVQAFFTIPVMFG